MSESQMEEGKQGGEDERVVANLRTCATCSLYDTASVCNSAEFELISKPGEHDSKVFKFGIRLSSVAHRF